MKNFAVIGSPIEHSWSPRYFSEKFRTLRLEEHSYKAIEIKNITSVREQLASEKLSGFNVTIPHKQSIIHYLDEISYSASAINAVNTVKVENGKWIGYNTDYVGFRDSLSKQICTHHNEALIFGSGGASVAIRYALRQLGISYRVVSRKGGDLIHYEDINKELITRYKLLINTTPVGMYPNTEDCLVLPYDALTSQHLCYDLVYNPEKTLFLKKSEEQNAKVMNGLEMLKIQAEKAWKIWNM